MGSSLGGSGLGQVDHMNKCVSPWGHSYALVGAYDIDMGYSECRYCGHRKVRSITVTVAAIDKLLGRDRDAD